MHHDIPRALYFHLSTPAPCPYIEGLMEQKIFTELPGPNPNPLNELLSRQGFRRAQNILYRPACANCHRCVSVRIPVKKFTFTKSLKRILKRNSSLQRTILSPRAHPHHYRLFRRYLSARHTKSDMVEMNYNDYRTMIEDTPISTALIEYRGARNALDGGALLCITDELSDGLSMVYSFFDPEKRGHSLGTYAILDHIRLAQENGLAYVYLGYWVRGAPNMEYKARFRPLEAYWGTQWVAFESICDEA